MKYIISVIILFIFIVLSCSTGYLVNMNEPTKFPEGRNLFVSKCSGCHKYHNPTEFTESKWDSILIPMKSKAKLTEKEKTLIFSWISEKINNDTIRTEQSYKIKKDNK